MYPEVTTNVLYSVEDGGVTTDSYSVARGKPLLRGRLNLFPPEPRPGVLLVALVTRRYRSSPIFLR
jgi:hypothetical protein